MKALTTYITEKLKIKKPNNSYKYFPETKEELKDILDKLIEERGYNGDFNDIDVSEITDMENLFDYNTRYFNGDISKWDVSNVTNMRKMFEECDSFEGKGLNNWNVSKVKDMNNMFYRCKSFNQDISGWDVSKVTDKGKMFVHCPIERKYKYKPKFKK